MASIEVMKERAHIAGHLTCLPAAIQNTAHS